MKSNMSKAQLNRLSMLFQDRLRSDKIERIVYSHDMSIMPKQIKDMINSMPDAIVQPISTDEVVSLAQFAIQEKIPLVPRGAASAGYGGGVPAKAGIVVDFVRMKDIISVNKEEMTVEVEPGVVWEKLENYLNKEGLALLSYPSSAKSATVAGWIAQGGNGYGGYMYGDCRNSVISVDLVQPNGEIKRYDGEELDHVYGLCGITGMIIKATLKIRPQTDNQTSLIQFDQLADAADFLIALSTKSFPVWNAGFSTPAYVDLKQRASEHDILPADKYYILLVYANTVAKVVQKGLADLLIAHKGKVMPQATADEEWEDRFYPMRFKKLGPTTVASEVILPIKELGRFVDTVEKRYKGKFALEGTMVGRDHMSILGFMLADERKLGFPLAFASSLDVVKQAENSGGRVFTLGLYFADYAEKVYGRKRLEELWEFKQQIDPQRIMNPGKVIPPSLDKEFPAKMLLAATKLANAGSGLIGMTGRLLLDWQGSSFSSPVNEQMTEDALACALCGYCRDVCAVFETSPWESNSARGKYFLLTQYIQGRLTMDEEMGKAIFPCTTCKRCDTVCQVKSENAQNWMALRNDINRNQLHNTGLEIIRNNVLTSGNFWGVESKDRLDWLDVPTDKEAKIAYWSGCWAGTITDNMAQNFTHILDHINIPFNHYGEDERCCGLYLYLGGYKEDFYQKVRRNVELFNESKAETILFSCPGCYATFSEIYPHVAKELGLSYNVEFKHIIVYLSELIAKGDIQFKKPFAHTVTYHDACHTGRWFGHYEEPRAVINAIPEIELREMEHIKEDGLCCGLVSSFDSLEVVANSGIKRIEEAENTGAEYLVTSCAGCGAQFHSACKAMGKDIQQLDLAELVARALDLPVKDQSDKIVAFMNQAVELLKDSKVVPTVIPPLRKSKTV